MALSMFVWIYSLTALFTASVAYAGLDDCSSLPAPNNGQVQMAFSKSGQLLALYICNEGYAAVGETVLSCVSGKWDKIPPFCASLEECELNVATSMDSLQPSCPKLTSPQNGRMDISLEGNLKQKATFNCRKGYYLNGEDTLHCEQGEWKGQVPKCKPVDCQEPEAPENGTVAFEHTYFLARARYACDACHVLNGVRQRSCKPSGTWSKSVPECVLLTDVCSLSDLPDGAYIPNASDLLESGVDCGQTVQIQCLSGFQLEGSDKATCNTDGTLVWSGSCTQVTQ